MGGKEIKSGPRMADLKRPIPLIFTVLAFCAIFAGSLVLVVVVFQVPILSTFSEQHLCLFPFAKKLQTKQTKTAKKHLLMGNFFYKSVLRSFSLITV